MKIDMRVWSYVAQFFLEWEMFWTEGTKKNQKTHFVFSNFFFLRKFRCLWDNVEIYCGAREATDDMAHARCMLLN